VVLGKNFVFITLAAVICRKHFILRYLESKHLKTKNLSGAVREAATGSNAMAG
jgi:hypothetical protein